MRIQTIALERIRRGTGTQMRERMSEDTVREYATQMREGLWDDARPHCVVFFDEGNDVFWLADGFHRIEAAARNNYQLVKADVRKGTRRDAVLEACRANALHGLPRTTADKRRAVETLLRDEEWATWSNREIARHIHVDDKTVGKIRAEIESSGAEIPHLTTPPSEMSPETQSGAEIPQVKMTRKGRDGKTYRFKRPQTPETGAEIPHLTTPPSEMSPEIQSGAEIPQVSNTAPSSPVLKMVSGAEVPHLNESETAKKRELNWQFEDGPVGIVCPICLQQTELHKIFADHDDAFGCCAVSGLAFKELTDGVQHALDRLTIQRNGYAGEVQQLQAVIARYRALYGPLPTPGSGAEIPHLTTPPSASTMIEIATSHARGRALSERERNLEEINLLENTDSLPEREGKGFGENLTESRAISTELLEWAAKEFPHLDAAQIESEVAKFHDHHAARGTRLKNPAAEIRKWIRRAGDYYRARAEQQPPAQRTRLSARAESFQTRKIREAIGQVRLSTTGGRVTAEQFRDRVRVALERDGINYDGELFDELLSSKKTA
jgi:hypothetical protein